MENFVTTFDPLTHIATVNNVVWPSTTQLLQEFKLIDFSRVPPERLERKRIIGTVVHRATIFVDNGTIDEEAFNELYPDCVGYLNAYRKFREVENFEPQYKENRYFSPTWKFHGAPDESGFHLAKFGKKNVLIDYKCSWQMYPCNSTQLQGYKILLEENISGLKIDELWGLQLKETGHYELLKYDDPQSYQDFLACVILHWRKRTYYQTTKGVESNGGIYS